MPSLKLTILSVALSAFHACAAVAPARSQPRQVAAEGTAAKCRSKPLLNGGFETGSFSPWTCSTSDPEGSCTVVNGTGAANTKHYAHLQVASSDQPNSGGPGVYNYVNLLNSYFYGCANTTYNIGYSILQPSGLTTWDGQGRGLQMLVYLNGGGAYPLLSFTQFYDNNFNVSMYSPYFSSYYPQDRWIKQYQQITVPTSDYYFIQAFLYAFADQVTATPNNITIQLDQFTVSEVK